MEGYDSAYQRTRSDQRYEILKGRAYNKHCIGDHIGAIGDLTDMITLRPENAKYHTRRGITRGEIAHYQGAIDDFDKVAEISGFDADLHNVLAHAYEGRRENVPGGRLDR